MSLVRRWIAECIGPLALRPKGVVAYTMPMNTFSQVPVVVTGGSGALGRAVVSRLLDAGAEVHVPWLEERELEDFPRAGEVALKRVDLAEEEAVIEYYGRFATEHCSPLWASIHLAGGFGMAPATETTKAEFERLFTMNAMTCFLCSREAIRAIRRGDASAAPMVIAGSSRGPRGGRIVNVGARPAVVPVPGMIAYSVSKAAVASLTQHLAEELRPANILINAVLPGIMDTPANRAAMPVAEHARWSKVEEVAESIVWLASTANALTSGALIPVYGAA